jgi:hypothetical protein
MEFPYGIRLTEYCIFFWNMVIIDRFHFLTYEINQLDITTHWTSNEHNLTNILGASNKL